MEKLRQAGYEIKRRMPELIISENEPMSAHCSFKIGGPAAFMAKPCSISQTRELVSLLNEFDISPLIMGKGTNLLVTDEPLNRFVIRFGDELSEISQTGGDTLTAGCGATLAQLAKRAQSRGLDGLCFAHGIPGTVGGGVSMNAGAYGGEMKDVIKSVTYLDEGLKLKTISGEHCRFKYRQSMFTGTGCIILSCQVQLVPGEPLEIEEKMRELMAKRKQSQPLNMPSAGSTFKRPENGYAAEMIDKAGLRGYTVGAAQVSEKHCGFVVNRGGAGFCDVLKLMEHIQNRVFERFGVMLEPEVKIIKN
jgi:UDP-N-acetylenolpyruvoylglucosamine reductase